MCFSSNIHQTNEFFFFLPLMIYKKCLVIFKEIKKKKVERAKTPHRRDTGGTQSTGGWTKKRKGMLMRTLIHSTTVLQQSVGVTKKKPSLGGFEIPKIHEFFFYPPGVLHTLTVFQKNSTIGKVVFSLTAQIFLFEG